MFDRFFQHIAMLFIVCTLLSAHAVAAEEVYTLSNQRFCVSVDCHGNLVQLSNLQTGQNYATGSYLWRIYYQSPNEKEIQVTGEGELPKIRADRNRILIIYKSLEQGSLHIGLTLTITLEDDYIRFASDIENHEPHTIVRELHYPLVGNVNLPEDHKLFTTYAGGQLYPHVKDYIIVAGNKNPYMTPAQYYRQLPLQYPNNDVAANCFALIGEQQGLYFGSHDKSFQNTYHGLRVYPDTSGRFTRLEAGIYKYPNCTFDQHWSCDANVVTPYSGTWHETSRLYRQWANTWWDHRSTPSWVKKMKSWQRIIFRHQYGTYLFRYNDLPGRVKQVGASVGANAVMFFGWWQDGMDHGNPDYDADSTQGGEEGLKRAIAQYNEGGNHVMLYFNGKLIDRESRFYRSGAATPLTFKDNTGAEITENYKFTGMGSFLGAYDTRSFVVADTRYPLWRKMMLEWADRAYDLGVSSIFFDQMGSVEKTGVNWDTSGEYPIPYLFHIADKAETLKLIRDHIATKDPEFAIGTEHLTDVTCQYCDFIHSSGTLTFIDWFRYTFPEIIISDRGIRDDSDIERRVNFTLLKGLRNDIEIYRCRDLIDKTPHYQSYLAQANAIKERYSRLLLEGIFRDKEGFSISDNTVEARSFINNDEMAIVITRTTKGAPSDTVIDAPGYRYVESATLGKACVSADGQKVTLGQYDLAVLVYKRSK
jgi:hypothetical protein